MEHIQYVSRNTKNYLLLVTPSTYIQDKLENGCKVIHAKKHTCIIIHPVVEGEDIPVYSTNGKIEAFETGIKGHWVSIRCNLDGSVLIDKYGHMNMHQISEEVLLKKYVTDSLTDGAVLKPRGNVQSFIRVDRDIALLLPWGENGTRVPQTIDAGGYINITHDNDLYGIVAEDFDETYSVVD